MVDWLQGRNSTVEGYSKGKLLMPWQPMVGLCSCEIHWVITTVWQEEGLITYPRNSHHQCSPHPQIIGSSTTPKTGHSHSLQGSLGLIRSYWSGKCLQWHISQISWTTTIPLSCVTPHPKHLATQYSSTQLKLINKSTHSQNTQA